MNFLKLHVSQKYLLSQFFISALRSPRSICTLGTGHKLNKRKTFKRLLASFQCHICAQFMSCVQLIKFITEVVLAETFAKLLQVFHDKACL